MVPDKNFSLGEITILKDQYLMMADNRAAIYKDKAGNFNIGTATAKNTIEGKIFFRLFPFSKMGIIKF